LLIATLDRRVKNLLARVAAVAKDMRHGNDSLDEYIQALDRRIQSMSDAHSLLSQNRSNGVDLAELVRRQLVPDGPDANTRLSGPNIALPVAVTQTLAIGAQRVGDERCEIRRAVDPAWAGGGELEPRTRRG
jgi:two-component sensor histidine kinase